MNDKFISLSWAFIRDKETTMQEKLILMEINNLSMLKYGCIAMNEHFADLMGIKKNAVSRIISSLENKGYITSKIKKGSRNFSRTITINKMLFNPSQNVIQPITKCEETKENITVNITVNTYEGFLSLLKEKASIKSKVTKTKDGEIAYKKIEDKEKLFNDYLDHQLKEKNFAKRITAFMEDYDFHNSTSNKENEKWGGWK